MCSPLRVTCQKRTVGFSGNYYEEIKKGLQQNGELFAHYRCSKPLANTAQREILIQL
jgi:hypothetical protein